MKAGNELESSELGEDSRLTSVREWLRNLPASYDKKAFEDSRGTVAKKSPEIKKEELLEERPVKRSAHKSKQKPKRAPKRKDDAETKHAHNHVSHANWNIMHVINVC